MTERNENRRESRKEAGGLRSSESVLARIWTGSGPVPRIRLRSEIGEVVEGAAPPRENGGGRYEVREEIARGGIGIVLRGRDVDLGREVAMKVIRPEYARSPEVLVRFIEEAQVGGQLQHPGIVPVYEFGQDEDARVFFTMKLIRGQTFAEMLAARADVSADRRRIFAVFEQVCQTVAYAHSRGVIHRDLKPVNVMVGSFGEVQVVDWGLAKVLTRDDEPTPTTDPERAPLRTVRSGSQSEESRVGSVLGTPGWMSPEQARGRLDHVDERADVFALGSILCEILTGAPAYTGRGTAGIRMAARWDIDDAMSRLRRCRADEELVTLCQHCLARGLAQRPRHAGEVAEAVASHLARVEERARAAEVEAETAKVKAREDRRARKLTLAIAAAVGVALLIVGGGTLLLRRARQRSEERIAEVVGAAEAEASERRGAAEGARSDLGAWTRAVEAASLTVERARTHGASAEVVLRAQRTLAEVEREDARARRNDAILRHLAETRLARGDRLRLGSANADYAKEFAAFGIGGEDTNVEAAAAAILETGVAEELAIYLDEWLWLLGTVDRPRDHLLEIAKRVDPDPWRNRLREAAHSRDRETLVALAAKADLTGSTPSLLARHLTLAGRREEAVDLLRRAQRERPEDFWIAYDLGWELTMLVPPRWEEAIGLFRVARSRRPESLEVRHQLGIALLKTERPEEALPVFEEMVEEHPEDLHPYDHVIDTWEMRGDLAGLVARCRDAAEADPGNAALWYRLGRAREATLDQEGMVAAYARAIAADPGNPLYAERLGYAHLCARDVEAARSAFERALSIEPDHAMSMYGLALLHLTTNTAPEAIAVLQDAVASNPWRPLHHFLLGEILGDAKRFDEAREAFDRAFRVYPDASGPWVARGGLRQRQGDLEGAIELYEIATRMPERFVETRSVPTVEWRLDPETGKPVQTVLLQVVNQKARSYVHLGNALQRLARFAKSRPAFEHAIELDPDLPAPYSGLAEACRLAGDMERAAECYRFHVDRENDPYSLYFLGFCRLAQGRVEEGAEWLRRFAEHDFMRRAPAKLRAVWDRYVPVALALAEAMPAILAGEKKWASPKEEAVAGWLAMDMARPALAARLLREAFAADPSIGADEVPWPVVFTYATYATGAALLAGLDLGLDRGTLTPEERAAWRRQALEWMRWDLDLWRERNDPDQEARLLRELRVNLIYALYRQEQTLADLPAEEADGWRDLWRRFDGRLEILEREGR